MMIHDQLLSTQLLMNVKNEHSKLLNSAPTHNFHGHLNSNSVSGLNMDIYSAYAFQAHLQQRQQQEQQQQKLLREAPEVLDLSRRCDSVETPRKTPSPYQTNSSATGTPPLLSPTSSTDKHAPALLSNPGFLHTPQTLYPMLYFPHNMQTDLSSNAATTKTLNNLAEKPAEATVPPSTLIQNFAPKSESCKNESLNKLTIPTTKNSSSLDSKNTRPFKAFPRDPLVIAANFAATDVLLDNPRVERYTEYRKRVLEQIRNSNGGSRTVTNPKMRRTSSRSNCITDGVNNHLNSENEGTVEEYSDCDSNVGNFERISHSMNSSTSSIDLDSNNNNNNTSVTTTTNTEKINNKNNSVPKTSSSSSSSYGTVKDAAYYERRRKNNAAAKKSRDRRRIKEDEIAIRAAYLERQNIELLCQIDALKAQLNAYTSKMVGV